MCSSDLKAYVSLFSYLLQKLDSVVESNGTLLDNSISVLGSEYGGNNSDGDHHAGTDLPILISGGGGGFLKTNQILNAGGRSHTQMLGSLLEYFGLEDGSGNLSRDFGDRGRGFSFASLPGLKA